MRANGFALLVTGTGGALHATHLPAVVAERGGALAIELHMAKANPQWREFFDDEVLVVFSGPHAFVSARWYEQTERVPTWNYAAVHAYGRVRMIEDRAGRLAAQARLVETYDPEWSEGFRQLSPEYLRGMLEGIVNFEVSVTRLEARWKLSQNRGRNEQLRIASELDRSAQAGARELAALTRRHLVPE